MRHLKCQGVIADGVTIDFGVLFEGCRNVNTGWTVQDTGCLGRWLRTSRGCHCDPLGSATSGVAHIWRHQSLCGCSYGWNIRQPGAARGCPPEVSCSMLCVACQPKFAYEEYTKFLLPTSRSFVLLIHEISCFIVPSLSRPVRTGRTFQQPHCAKRAFTANGDCWGPCGCRVCSCRCGGLRDAWHRNSSR